LGTLRLTAIDASIVDELYGDLLVVNEANADGNTIERESQTTVNHQPCHEVLPAGLERCGTPESRQASHVNPSAAMASNRRIARRQRSPNCGAFCAKVTEQGAASCRSRR
jgi:hypothetical protein